MITEKQMGRAWREGQWIGLNLATTGGQRFRVLYPGYSGLSWGPDFRRAVIALQRKKVQGDVEFHVRSREWVEHGHHLDMAYDGVILHIVWENDMPGPTLTRGGRSIPVFLASQVHPRQAASAAFLPCRRYSPLGTGLDILSRQGELWFHQKSLEALISLENLDIEEALYRGIMQALGYSENKAAFYKLACMIPFREAQRRSVSLRGGDRLQYIRELYLNMAGLRSGISGKTQDADWSNITGRCLERASWQFHGLRPANHPVNRLLAGASLINRYLDTGLVPALLGNVKSMDAGKSYPLEALLVESGPQSGRCRGKPLLLGKGRALLIAVNILLPFACALGIKRKDRVLRGKAEDMFRSSPPLEDNVITRHFHRFLRLPYRLKAREQQGLLRLERKYCSKGKCGLCPLSKSRV